MGLTPLQRLPKVRRTSSETNTSVTRAFLCIFRNEKLTMKLYDSANYSTLSRQIPALHINFVSLVACTALHYDKGRPFVLSKPKGFLLTGWKYIKQILRGFSMMFNRDPDSARRRPEYRAVLSRLTFLTPCPWELEHDKRLADYYAVVPQDY